MEDLLREATETTEETRETTAGNTPFPAGHEGGNNHSDPIPYFGGLTQDEVTLWKNNGTRGLENVDDDLFAAIMRGDETRVRGRIGGSDKILSEAEALILIRTREHEEEIEYEKMLEQKFDADGDDDEDPALWQVVGHEADMGRRPGFHFFGHDCDKYGGRYDRKKVRYHDRFGGFYDTKGYQFADGSYKTAGGDHYDAATHTVRLAIGGPAEQLPIELLGHGADVLRVACKIAALRAEKRRGAIAELREVATVTADALAAAQEMQTAEAAAQRAVHTVTGAAPKAVAASATFTKAANDETTAYMAASADREADELAQFERMVGSEDFQRTASDGAGDGLEHMSCSSCTRQELRMAAAVVGDNILKGNLPHQLNRYHYQNIISMVDDDEDGQVDRLKLRLNNGAPISISVPPLTPEANHAFRKMLKGVVVAACRLKDHATAAFAKKEPESPYEATIAQAMEQQKPRLNFFRRAGAGLNVA